MYKKLILLMVLSGTFVSCKKEDEKFNIYQKESKQICKKWKVQSAFKNSSGNESDNGEDVSYDWDKWSIEFWNHSAFEIMEYSPDSAACTIISGTWQMDTEGQLLLQGTENLIVFDSGLVIDEGETQLFWEKKKIEENMVWIWIENSYYGPTGVFLKLIPY